MRGIQYHEVSRLTHERRGLRHHPLEPVIVLAEGETRWRMTTSGVWQVEP
jgi:hypothetical protein